MHTGENKAHGIMICTCFDGQYNSGYLTTFCERLSNEVRVYTGEDFPIFQHIKDDIQWGEDFAACIEDGLHTVQFFIPILTPSFFKSEYCRQELQYFLQRAAERVRYDPILPIYYIPCPNMDDPISRAADPLARTLAKLHYADWRWLRTDAFDAPLVRETLAHMAKLIRNALCRMETCLPPAPDPEMSPLNTITIPDDASPPDSRAPGYGQPISPTDVQSLDLLILWETAFNPTREPDPRRRNAAAEELDRRNADERSALDLEHPDYWAHCIPPGPFLMGNANGEDDDEKPAFVAHIRRPYALARFPVTNRQYLRFLNDLYGQGLHEAAQHYRPYFWVGCGYPPGRGNHPVVGVSWIAACTFAAWVNDLLHARGRLQPDEAVRLPTELEWERAATYPVTLPPGPPGTGKRIYPWGNEWHNASVARGFSPAAPANVDGVIEDTSVVGIFPHGAADCRAEELAGNVFEGCSTPYQNYPLPEDITVSTIYNIALSYYDEDVLRGGSWDAPSSVARGTYRLGDPPDALLDSIGLRLVRVFT